MGIEYKYFDVIDSTNNEAKRIITALDDELDHALCIVAKEQTAGRGRQGKTFHSPSGTGIYMTVVIPMGCAITGQVGITTVTASVVARAIEEECRKNVAIKWVNDIYTDDKKCCGILAEAVNDYDRGILRHAVIGVGINLAHAEFPDELKSIATSVLSAGECDAKETEQLADRLVHRISEDLCAAMRNLSSDEYRNYYIARSNVIGRQITFAEAGLARCGKAVGIDSDGGLIVETEEGVKVLNSGEISVRTV